MKLFKKLLPIATVGCVAAVVTPLATSCGGSMFDGYNAWIPKTPKAVWDHKNFPDGYHSEEGLNLYLTDVKNNPDVFIDDMYYVISGNLVAERSWCKEYNNEFKCKVNIKYENITADPANSTMSYKVSGSVYVTLEGAEIINLKHFSFDVKNILYYAEIYDVYRWGINYDAEGFLSKENQSLMLQLMDTFYMMVIYQISIMNHS